jgi:hypothetical protein
MGCTTPVLARSAMARYGLKFAPIGFSGVPRSWHDGLHRSYLVNQDAFIGVGGRLVGIADFFRPWSGVLSHDCMFNGPVRDEVGNKPNTINDLTQRSERRLMGASLRPVRALVEC